MPWLIPVLFGTAAFFAGTFTGSQVDDAIDQPPAETPITQAVNFPKIMLYGAGGLALYWLANKSGALKAIR